MNNSKLKPCPFCGGKACTLIDEEGYTPQYSVQCQNCKIETLAFDKKAEAIAAWNKRTNPDAANFSYSKKSNNSELGNYSEKQDSPNELMEFVRFCADASTGCIVYINNRARDIIAKSKEKRVCVKQNGETLDTNSVASSRVNAKLTYADIKKMVQPLKWKYISGIKAHYASTNKGMFFKICKENGDYVLSINGNNPVAFSEKLSKIKQAAQEFLVDLVAAALGVERSGE